MSDDLTELFNGALVVGANYSLRVIYDYAPDRSSYWSLKKCFDDISSMGGGVIRIDISKTSLQRMLNNVTSY